LINSPSLSNLRKRYYYLKMIAYSDKRLIEEIKRNIHRRSEVIAIIERDKGEKEFLLRKGEEHGENLEKGKKEKNHLIQNLFSERRTYEKAIEELKESRIELENLIARMEKDRNRSRDEGTREMELNKGDFLWPVKGEVCSRYGKIKHPRFWTETFNKGIDLEAEEGEPVLASSPGEIAFIGWLHGLGRCVIIDHKTGIYTLYGHLSEVIVDHGEYVTGGEMIGEAGMSGMVENSQLHFEIWQGRKAQNPEIWLKKRK
jgi:murein DD-endopeptidase MepM/ murein hydrolase activator NlpD